MMKQINLIIAAFLVMISYSCNPSAGKELVTEFVKLNAEINIVSETIQIGDTLKISLKLPNKVMSNLRTQEVQSLERGFYAMYINKIDTVNKKATLVQPPNYWLTKGNREGSFFFVMNTNAKPYEVVLNIKPPEKGLYYLEVIAQPGVLKINNNYEANLLVNFNVPDKHFNILSLIAPSFGGQPFYDAFVQRDMEGFGTYFFRVE